MFIEELKMAFTPYQPPPVDNFDYGAATQREMEHQVMIQREHGIMMKDRPKWKP